MLHFWSRVRVFALDIGLPFSSGAQVHWSGCQGIGKIGNQVACRNNPALD
jgi:hypothetical protein